MGALERILGALLPSPIQGAKKVAKKSAAGSVAGAIGGAGKMNPDNTKFGIARAQLQPKQPLLYKLPGGGTSQFNPNSVTNAGNLTPRYEDGYDTTIKYLSGPVQQQQVSPITMGQYGGPRNIRVGRTNFIQGSNPYVNGRNWVDPQYQELGEGIQSPSFGAWQPRNRY